MPEPTTLWKLVALQSTILGFLSLKKSRNMTFPKAPPISSTTGSSRLCTIVGTTLATPKDSSKDWYPPQQSWNISKNDSDNPFNERNSSEEIVDTVRKPKRPQNWLSDRSNLDDGGLDKNKGPPRPFPQSSNITA